MSFVKVGRCVALFVQYIWETVGGKQICHIGHCEWKDLGNIDGFEWALPARGIKGTLLVEVACRYSGPRWCNL